MNAVELHAVAKSFRAGKQEVRAVTGVSLTVARGEYFVLVGPSGSGKTTLLRLIAGLEEVSAGTINFPALASPATQGEKVAMVFQSPALFPHLNVAQNIGFSLMLAKKPKSEVDATSRRIAEQLGLAGLLQRMPSELSGGEQQRVALGRALAQDAAIVLLDEPLSNLDLGSRTRIRRELKQAQRRTGKTFIHVTHDQGEAMALADRMAVLKSGELQQLGKPTEVYQEPKNLFVARFIGQPEMNILPAELLAEVGLPPGAKGMVAGFRPEATKFVHSDAAGTRWRITAVEAFGWEQHVWASNGEFEVAARAPAEAPFECGDAVRVEAAKALMFDAVTGVHAR